MLKVVFMGTPDFAVPSLDAVQKYFKVQAVYTQPDRPVGRGLEMRESAVKRRALELGLPVCQPEKLSISGEYEKLAALAPDVIVIVAYGQILRKNILELPRLGCVNVHSSLLPKWRGAAPIQWAVLSGDAETGVTTMKLVEKLDAGDILLQQSTQIGPEDTAGTVHDRLAQLGAELIVPTLNGLGDGSLSGKKQDETQVTYASKLEKEMEALDTLKQSAKELDLKIRALNPWPGTSVWLGRERLKIKKAKLRLDVQGPVGQLFERAGMALLGTNHGSLELQTLQWEGKKETDSGSFLNGLKGRGHALPLVVFSSGLGYSEGTK